MTIDEAIKELKEASIEASNRGEVKRVDAFELGIEALKRAKDNRAGHLWTNASPLPGETEESPSPLKGEEGQGDDPKKGDQR